MQHNYKDKDERKSFQMVNENSNTTKKPSVKYSFPKKQKKPFYSSFWGGGEKPYADSISSSPYTATPSAYTTSIPPQYNYPLQSTKSGSSSSKHCSEESLNYRQQFCVNCGKTGHESYQCVNPITSCGVILFRLSETTHQIQYLMIRRRDTLGYVDFLRGKYSLKNKKYIQSLLMQMTKTEIRKIQECSFDELWNKLWNINTNTTITINNGIKLETELPEHGVLRNSSERCLEEDHPLFVACEGKWKHAKVETNENTAAIHTNNRKSGGGSAPLTNRDKFNILKNEHILTELIHDCYREGHEFWNEPEWGFSKGRRNYRENDYDCAIREMEEETGYSRHKIKLIKNIHSFVEIFMSSNCKCYKHKYYLMYMKYEDTLHTGRFDESEVSCIRWMSFEDCSTHIRDYNIMKKKILANVHKCLTLNMIIDDEEED